MYFLVAGVVVVLCIMNDKILKNTNDYIGSYFGELSLLLADFFSSKIL